MSDREMPFRPGASVSVLGLGVSGTAAARLATARGAIANAAARFEAMPRGGIPTRPATTPANAAWRWA